MSPQKELPKRHAIRSAGLRLLYARFARRKGWNDHPMAVRQRVDLFLEFGTGPVVEAVAHYNACRRVWSTRTAHGLVAAGIMMIAGYAASHASPAAADVNTPPTTRPHVSAGDADVTIEKGKMPRSGLEPETR